MPSANIMLQELATGNDETYNTALNSFSEVIQELIAQMAELEIKVKSETNGLKLIASDKIMILLNELEVLLKQSFKATTDFFNQYIDLLQEPEKLQSVSEESIAIGLKVQNKRDELMAQMRIELDEI